MNRSAILLVILLLASIIGLWIYGRIPQDPDYHLFADGRPLWGIPNFLDVATNLIFLLIGLYALIRTARQTGYLVHWIMFTGIALVCFGSGWYHCEPNNATLVWDRLPMTVVFMSFFYLVLKECLHLPGKPWLFWGLLLFGAFSVLYWYYTETQHQGDMRAYILVQGFPMIAVPLLVLLTNTTLKRSVIWWVFVFYGLAKLTEYYDKEIFDALVVVSGHSLKHLMAGLASYFIYRLVRVPVVKR